MPCLYCRKKKQKLTSCDENHETQMNGRKGNDNQNDYLMLLIVLMYTRSKRLINDCLQKQVPIRPATHCLVCVQEDEHTAEAELKKKIFDSQ